MRSTIRKKCDVNGKRSKKKEWDFNKCQDWRKTDRQLNIHAHIYAHTHAHDDDSDNDVNYLFRQQQHRKNDTNKLDGVCVHLLECACVRVKVSSFFAFIYHTIQSDKIE